MKKINDILKDVNKTHQKIKAVEEKTNCSFYISERYIQEYHIIHLEFSSNTYNIECGPQYIDGNIKNIYKDKNIYPNMEI